MHGDMAVGHVRQGSAEGLVERDLVRQAPFFHLSYYQLGRMSCRIAAFSRVQLSFFEEVLHYKS